MKSYEIEAIQDAVAVLSDDLVITQQGTSVIKIESRFGNVSLTEMVVDKQRFYHINHDVNGRLLSTHSTNVMANTLILLGSTIQCHLGWVERLERIERSEKHLKPIEYLQPIDDAAEDQQ